MPFAAIACKSKIVSAWKVYSNYAKVSVCRRWYNTKVRRCAMLVLANALHNVVYHSDEFPLLPKPSCEDFITLEFLEMIADDLAVATRPPMASLGSAREATHAARFLHWTAAHRFVL